MSRKKSNSPIIVSTALPPTGKQKLDEACAQRGMTIKSLLGRLIEWFAEMDRTEQSIILGQVEDADMPAMIDLARRRRDGGDRRTR